MTLSVIHGLKKMGFHFHGLLLRTASVSTKEDCTSLVVTVRMEYIQGLHIIIRMKKKWERPPDIDKPRAAMGVESVGDVIYLIGGWEADGRTVMDTVAALHI